MKRQQTQKLHDYWRKLYAVSGIPERSAIEPMAIRDLLGDTFILEFNLNGDINYRLAGTRLCAAFGGELKGSGFSSPWSNEERETIDNILNSVGEDEVLAILGCTATSRGGRRLAVEILALPLVQNGEKHKRLLGITTPAERPYWLGMDPIVNMALMSLRIVDPATELVQTNNRFNMIKTEIGHSMEQPHDIRRVKHLTVLEGGRSDQPGENGINA